MKKLISIALVLVIALGLVACSAPAIPGTEVSTEPTVTYDKMTMGTGGSAGTYYAFGGVLGNQISGTTNTAVTVVTSDGSRANILGINTGDYQMGTVQSDVMAYAWEGTRNFEEDGKIDSFRVIGGLYAEAVQLATVNPDIKSVADLKGKKVSIGAPGSGVYFNAMDVLAAAGMTEDDIIPTYQSFADSADALKDGQIDAAFVVAGAPTTAISDLSLSKDVFMVPIDGEIAAAMQAANPFYTEYIIPAGTYAGQEEDVTTMAIKATLIVSANAAEDTVYNITKAIFDNIDTITTAHAKGAELSLENATGDISVPFHVGAAKYFAENGITVVTE